MTRSTGGQATARRRFGRIAVLGAAGLLAVAAATGVASASTQSAGSAAPTAALDHAPSGLYAINGHAAAQPAANDLTYHGGPIQDHAAVFLVFWGNQWNSDRNGVQAYVTNFFRGLGTSADKWSRVTSQYTDRSGKRPTFSGSVLKGVWVDNAAPAPKQASGDQLGAEARKAATHFHTSGHNASVIVLSPSGTHPDGFPNAGWCAWHSATGGLPFTNMPYVLDAGRSCATGALGGRLDGFSIVSGHEYLEAVTDPIPGSGWFAPNGENADLCVEHNLHKITLPTGSFAVQPTYSNKTHGCAG